MTILQKQKLFNATADKLKLASHFAESQRRSPPSLGDASTLWRLTGDANVAAKAYHHSMLGYEPPKEGG